MWVDIIPDDTSVSFWKRQNEHDEKELVKTEKRIIVLQLYCQSCCYRYPDECLFMDTLHPMDRSAETCPDYIPKDLYKGETRSKCLRKRLEIDPGYTPLPECDFWHPIYKPFVNCSSRVFYQIITKEKMYRKIRNIRGSIFQKNKTQPPPPHDPPDIPDRPWKPDDEEDQVCL